MGKKLTPKEKENRIIERIIKRIKSMEKSYGSYNVRSACQRYVNREREQLRLQKEIYEREKELQRLKKQKG